MEMEQNTLVHIGLLWGVLKNILELDRSNACTTV